MSAAPQVGRGDMVHIGTDWGGEVGAYYLEVGQAIVDGTRFCVNRVAASARTSILQLGTDQALTKQAARWGLHGVTRNGVLSQEATAILAQSYPADLRAWFYANGCHKKSGRDFCFLSGAQMIANGWAGEC